VGGGYENTASGDYSFIGGGSGNTAKGDHSIAMGKNANAETDRSWVINLLPGKDISSGQVGQFMVRANAFHARMSKGFFVHSRSFTIRIGNTSVIINKDNINNVKNVLEGSGRRLKQIDEQKVIVEKLHKQVDTYEERIVEQQATIEEQQLINEEQQSINEELREKMEKLHHMMTSFIAQQQQQQLNKANNY